MAETPVPITTGTGGASIAGDLVSGNIYQQIKIVDGTIDSNNPLKINTDGSAQVSIIGIPQFSAAGGSVGLLGGSQFIGNVGIASGSIATVASGNQSVSGTVGASIIGTVPVNIVAGGSTGSVATNIQGSVATVIIGGSIAASFTPPANQSVSGTVITISQGSVAAVIIGGSIAASFTPPANQSVSGQIVISGAGNTGSVIANNPGSDTQSGAFSALYTIGYPYLFNGTNWDRARGTIGSGLNVSVMGIANITGSVVSFLASTNASVITVGTAVANQSVSGTVGASIIGLPGIYITNSSGAISAGVMAGNTDNYSQSNNGLATVSELYVFDRSGGSVWSRWTGNSSIGALVSTGQSSVISLIQGSVATTVVGLQGASVSGTVGASIIGQLPAGTAMIGSVFAVVQGLQGASVSGSVGIVGNPSISGTVNIGGTAAITGSVTAILAPYSASTQGITSVMTGTSSVLVLAAPGGTSRNYITHILVTNAAGVGTTVTIQDGASILWGGYAAASGGGWSENFNPPLPQPTSVKALYATSSVQASVYVAINGFTGT